MGSCFKRSPNQIIPSSQTTVSLLLLSTSILATLVSQNPSRFKRGQAPMIRERSPGIISISRKEGIIIRTELINRWLRKTGAFDKKLQSQTTPGDHHGNSNLGLGFGLPLGMGMGGGLDEDREGSPTPQSGRGKKRRGSADE
jgi:hypothetical protein